MVVNSKLEFDTIMATATNATIIELPGGTINWELVVDKPCNIIGNETKVDLTGLSIPYAINLTADADISSVQILNDLDGVFINNCAPTLSQIISSGNIAFKFIGDGDGTELELLSAINSEIGFDLHDSRNFNLINCQASRSNIGFELGGDSDVVGDSTTDPSWVSGAPITEINRTDRTHHNEFINCQSFENSIGVRLVNSNHNTFTDCRIYDNTNIGIWHIPNSYTNKFNGENYGNINYGVKNTDRVHTFDATDVWWGDIAGPSGAGPGTGQKISSFVLYEPWHRTGTEPDLIYPLTREWIWNMLGYPLVRVELTEKHVTESIDMAINKWMYYQTPEPNWAYNSMGAGNQEINLGTLQDKYGNPISVTKDQVIEVVYQPYDDLFAQLSSTESSFFLTYYMQKAGGTFLADFFIAMSYKDDFELVLGLKPTWEFISEIQLDGTVKDIVRIYPIPTAGIKVGIKYSRAMTEAEVDNERWIRQYALTYAKEQLGRIRSKFASIPSPTGETTLDGSTLIAEAQQEREWLLQDAINRGEPLSFSIG